MTKTLDAKPTDAATLVQLFEQQAAKTPSAVALIAEDATFTYAELNARANRLAHELIRRGVQVEDKVALILPRDSRVVVSMYGIMKAGGAFIPIDPEYPQGRIAHYLSDSAARYVLTDKATAGAYPNAIEVDALLAASKNEANPNLPLSGRNLCYVIYTSGSTGVPKGVLLEHRGLVSCARCSEKNISVFKGVEHDVNAVCITTVSFDVFLLTLFAVLSNGQRFILANDEEAKNPLPMAALFKRTKGNYLCGTTSRLMEYLEYPEIREVAAGCKLIIQGGEKFPPALYEKLRAATSADIINAYGPTEVSIESNEKILASANLITVGAPLRDVVELIVSEAGEPLPPGVEGELWIGGPRVSRGYLNRPELNAERFVERDGVRYYKSGDKAKWTDDGEVIILGRNDNQIKLRGLRIELGEIENALAAVPGVKQGVVLVRTSRKQEHLCAWFTANRPIAAEELRAALSETLTAYMVPTAYMQLGEMPHTPNGKIDAKALPDITMKAAEVVPPVTDMQKAVFSIVADVLGSSEGLGITTELVFVGMTSLDATRIAAVITRQTGKKIGMVDVMNAKTIGRVATFLESAGQEAALQQLEQLDEYPLTQNQMGLYYECARRPNATMYNLPMEFSLLPRTDVARLEAALKATLAAHPYLNTYIKEKDGKPMQMRNDRAPAVVETCKASEEEYQKAKADFIVPFDLLHAPLYRLKIYQTPQAVYLLTDFHHIIFDGWSMGVFLSDLSRAFAGEALAPETFTAFDHALLEQRVDRTAQMEDDRKWYTALLGDGEGSTQLPADHESAQRGAQRELNAFLDPEFVDGAYRLHGTTGAPFFLAALSLLVSRFAGVRQVRLATVSAGRDSASLQDNMGMLVVTLPVVVDVPAEEAVDSFIDRVQARLRETLSRQAYPASRLFTDLQCLPQIVYAYQGAIIGHDVLDEQPLNMVELRPENPDFPLFVGISRERDKYKVKIEYDEALFERDTVQNILDSFVHVVHLLADTANRPRPLCELAVATQEQQRQIASFMKEAQVPDTLTPVAIFEQWAKEAPHATALIAADATLTYAELNERANRLANALLSKGLRKGDIVSLILHRDSRVLVSMLGIIKAGGAFLPIDPDYPQDRISHYINDSNARFSITDNPGAYPNGVDVDELISCENAANPNVAITPDDLCYVIYTSGSTGVPKGVMLRHGGLATYLSAASQTPHALACAKHKARLLSVSTISFDAFVLDTFSMLLNGLSLVLANDEEAKTPIPFAKLYQKTGANALMFTSARLQEYLQYPELREVFASAKIIEQGGEKFPAGLYEKIRKISQADIINMYGPTEATIASNEQQLSSGSIITVGAPIGGTVEQVMDIDGHPLPIGAVGELWIGGKGVAAGYWNRPELNAVRFAERDGVRYYKSGDLAKWTPGGEVIILGRNDGQIKLRGLRIELGEIENTLAAAPEIKQCVIKVRKLNGQDHLCAWYTAEREISADELHDRLAKTLTAYMVPTAYMQLQEMPHTPNGKIDAKALPDPQFISQHEYVAPASPAEAIFCKMFAGILQLSRVSAIDDFFTLGGTSLQVAQITVDAQKNSYEISYGDVFANPTPRALALLAQSKARSAKDTTANSEVDSYDYTKVNKLLQANTLEAFRSGQQRPLGNVLLTGATGFLGIHILREYLTAYEGNIYCLVRNRKLVSAEQRLRNMLFFYFSETFAEYFGKRLFVVDGDVTSEEDFAKLNDTPIDTVINCAANVKHFSHGTDIEDINIGGVQKGVDFCKRKGCRYIQISTTSVAGDSINGAPSPDIKIDEQMLYFGQDTANKYVHSKFLAERIVLEAASEGLDAKVMRAGNLMARNADGEFQINFNTNNFIGQLKANHVIGKIAYRDLEQPTEITPIDTTASAMLQLAQTPRACCLFHPYNTHLVLLADVIHVMNERGLRVEACEQEEFRKAFAQTAQDAAKAKYLSPLIAYNTASDDTVIPIAAQNKYTLQVLLRLGFQWPLVEDGYLVKFIENLHGLGFFDVPATSPA